MQVFRLLKSSRPISSACCGLARLAESVGNDYYLEGERMLAANPPAVICTPIIMGTIVPILTYYTVIQLRWCYELRDYR